MITIPFMVLTSNFTTAFDRNRIFFYFITALVFIYLFIHFVFFFIEYWDYDWDEQQLVREVAG